MSEQYELNIIDKELERKERLKKYAREYYKAYLKIPKNKLKHNERMRKYRQRPEVRERIKQYRKRYNQTPEAKQRLKEYNQKPEVKQRKKEYRQRPEVKVKINKAKYERVKIINTVNSIEDITLQWARLKKRKLVRDTKRRKNLTNITVELTPEDILDLIPKDLKCPIYKVPFVFNVNSPWNLSFDRINNNKSYTKDNVVIVSVKANTVKNTATSKELYKIADFYYELEKKQLDK
tara:strand:- start:3247 stop:3951 length:705 start_codon:yes stop_codon:yes gene_type:complete